jgi:hypothetical protein
MEKDLQNLAFKVLSSSPEIAVYLYLTSKDSPEKQIAL